MCGGPVFGADVVKHADTCALYGSADILARHNIREFWPIRDVQCDSLDNSVVACIVSLMCHFSHSGAW